MSAPGVDMTICSFHYDVTRVKVSGRSRALENDNHFMRELRTRSAVN